METNPYDHPSGHRLNLFDSTCLIIGIVVGSGIYETPASVAQAASYPWEVFLLWTVGGIVSLCGALCYAELASTYPESGGDVVYLSRAYGKWAGFLFGWLQTFVARPGDISLMALVFAHYVHVLVDPTPTDNHPIWPAILIVCLLTAVNIAGLRFGKTAQNVLTVIKIAGLFLIIAFAFASGGDEVAVEAASAPKERNLPIGVALILVLFTYGGWNEMVYVASEVREPRRNLSRALILGAVAVTVMYLFANAAYLKSLTLQGMADSKAIATDAVAGVLPRGGQMLVAAVITISAAGAINGLVLTGARITGAMRVYPAFRWLGHWDPRLQTPVRALILEGLIAIAVISIAQTFENALIYTSAAVYTFYLTTAWSTAVLRFREPKTQRPFRVPLFPVPLIIFTVGCSWTIWSALNYRPTATLVCLGILVTGLIVYWCQRSAVDAGVPGTGVPGTGSTEENAE